MSDAYGTVIVSGNFKADLAALTACLNSYRWASDDCEFVVTDSYIWGPTLAQYPTAYPDYQVTVDDAGNEVDVTDDDSDLYKTESRPIPLEVLAANISQHIDEGYLELTAVSHEKNRYACFETIKIHADGRADRSRHTRLVGAVGTDEISA